MKPWCGIKHSFNTCFVWDDLIFESVCVTGIAGAFFVWGSALIGWPAFEDQPGQGYGKGLPTLWLQQGWRLLQVHPMFVLAPPLSLFLSLFLFCLLLSTLVPYWCLMNMYTKHLFTTLSIELCSVIHPKYTCRSPWSNKYDPPLPDGAVPSDRLRRLEVEANQAFDTYREL